MRTLRLAWAYVAHHRWRTGVLVLCVALTMLLPLAVARLVDGYAADLGARAEGTPLVVGAPGSRFDLVLSTLHFRGRLPRPTSMAEVERIREGGLAEAIPVHAQHTARGLPVVGTTPEYFALRRLVPAEGTAPLVLGEATLGAEAARTLGVGAGGKVLTDRGGAFEFSLRQPLLLRVVGVFAPTGTPDDRAVFVDVKTAWVLDGTGHGHGAAESQAPERILRREGETVVLDASVVEATEITPETLPSFHFHGDPAGYAVTGILVLPRDEKAATILKGRYHVSTTAQALDPREVVDELLGLVFQVKRFFDANVILVCASTALLLGLVVLLTVRLRRREIETLAKIGATRATIVSVFAAEWAIVLLAGAAVATLLALTVVQAALRDLLP